MSSVYGLVEADLTPNPIAAALWLQLLDDDKDGTVNVSAADLIAAAESRFRGWLCGVMTDADNIATAKPYVVDVAVYMAHFHRAQNADYKVPDEVKDAFSAARTWAVTEGRALLAGEGTESPPGAGAGDVDYTAPDDDYTTDKLAVL